MFIKQSAFGKAYKELRRHAQSSLSAVLIFVALDPDAVCASKMLAILLKRDFIPHTIYPVAGYADLQTANQKHVADNLDLRVAFLINCGALIDLTTFLSPQQMTSIYVIDSHRPWNLANAFADATNIFVFDDGELEKGLSDVGLAFRNSIELADEALGSDSDLDDIDQETSVSSLNAEGEVSEPPSNGTLRQHRNANRQLLLDAQATIARYYSKGSWFGDSAATQMYSLIADLGHEDNDLLWYGIVGLALVETQNQIPSSNFMNLYTLFKDEVCRLNIPMLSDSTEPGSYKYGTNSFDYRIQARDEFRFMMIRHWTLYEAMKYSPYIGSRLHIWSDKGQKRLDKMLAKMGFSLVQAKQLFTLMNIELKRALKESLRKYAGLYGCEDIFLPSFVRSFGYKCTLSASDTAYIIGALLSAGKLLSSETFKKANKDDGEVIEDSLVVEFEKSEEWIENFWIAFDALDNVGLLTSGIPLAMDIQKAVVRTGTALIEKKGIQNLRSFRMACLKDGPDLHLFTHPLVLSKLALWVAEAINGKQPLPFVIAALNCLTGLYLVVATSTSTTSSNDGSNERIGVKNKFGLAFQEIARSHQARLRMDSFETSVLECRREDLMTFFESLSLQMI